MSRRYIARNSFLSANVMRWEADPISDKEQVLRSGAEGQEQCPSTSRGQGLSARKTVSASTPRRFFTSFGISSEVEDIQGSRLLRDCPCEGTGEKRREVAATTI